MAFVPYATRPEFEAWAQLSDQVDATVIDAILVSVTRWVDEFTDRHFWQDGATGSEVARVFASNCGWDVAIDDLVPGSLTTLKTDATGDGTFETTWSSSDYQLLPVNRPGGEPYTSVESVSGVQFPTRTGNVGRVNRIEITGVWGWATVPPAVKLACLMQAQRDYKERWSPQGIIGNDILGAVRTPGNEHPRALTLLKSYINNRTAVLVA